MLKIDEELMQIDDQIMRLVKALKQTSEYRTYHEVKQAIERDEHLQEQVSLFEEKKEAYELLEPYRHYLPEAREAKRQLFRLKRELDLYPLVRRLRQVENALQELLAQVSQVLAEAVDEDIFVETGLPFAPKHKPHGKGTYRNIREEDDV